MSLFECPACAAKTRHTADEWRLHPYRGHGYAPELGWTHLDLKPKMNSLSPACCSTKQTCVSGVKQ